MDFLEKLKQLAEGGGSKKDPLRTRIVWNIVEKGDRLLLLLPNLTDIDSIDNEEIFQEYRETLHEILLSKPTYVVAYIPGLSYTNQTIHLYEKIYGVEIQWLPDLSLLKNNQFMEYHRGQMYLLKQDLLMSEIDTSYTTKAILDVLEYDKEIVQYLQDCTIPLHYGKCFLEEVVNINIYMNKLVNRIQNALEDGVDNAYDISFIIGKTQIPFVELYQMIMNTLKTNQCSLIFSCQTEVTKKLPTLRKETKTRIPLVDYDHEELDIDMVHDLVGRLQRISSRYTTHIFIGTFSFDTKETKDLWYKHVEALENISIFDVAAYDTLLKDVKKEKKHMYRLSKEVPTMVRMFLESDTDPLGKDTKEEYEEDEDYEEDCCEE